MSADKRNRNWVLVIVVLALAIIVPVLKVSRGEEPVNQGIDLVGGVDMLLQGVIPEEVDENPSDLIEGAISILRNRIDPEGVKEIIIQRLGEDRIVIQIPGEDDPEYVKSMIGATATLRFVDVGNYPLEADRTRVHFIDPNTGEEVNLSHLNAVGTEAYEMDEEDTGEEAPVSTVTAELVVAPANMTGFILLSAEPDIDPGAVSVVEDEPVTDENPSAGTLALEVDVSTGTQLVTRTTSSDLGRYFGLVLDDELIGLHEITGALVEGYIPWPGLADEPDFDLAWYTSNLPGFRVVAFEEDPPEIGSVIEVFDPTGLLQMDEPVAEGPVEDESGTIWVDIPITDIILTGEDFADADVSFDQMGKPVIAFEFKSEGRSIFGDHTQTHVGQYLAILLDDRVLTCPRINEPILHGRGQISGAFSVEEARQLVIKLDSGRLPIPLEIIENRTISPTLGAKSIEDSKRAALIGGILILLFMLVYYRLPGFMADLALIFYMVVFYGALSVLNATLTLPGIAGFILSVGMAVDANVIIFERLKEELKTGKTFRSAIEAAFKRAFLAIFDANVTTLITALVLYNLGTGPIKGFAVTLSLGILVSMFSALVFTRLLLETALSNKGFQKYSLFGLKEKDVLSGAKGGDAK